MADTRDAQIVRLLDTRFDNLPEPVRRTNTSAGFVHKAPARVPCEDCLANDRTMYGCETCHGRGYVEVTRERDPYATDQKVQPYGLDGTYLERVKARDVAIDRVEQQLAPPKKTERDLIEEANQHPYAWELARRRMYEQFDYEALDRALEDLRHSSFVDISPRSASGLRFLSVMLPDPLRAPPPPPEQLRVVGKLKRGAGVNAREVRDAEIRELAEEGLKPVEIAVKCHVSIRTVYNVVNAQAA